MGGRRTLASNLLAPSHVVQSNENEDSTREEGGAPHRISLADEIGGDADRQQDATPNQNDFIGKGHRRSFVAGMGGKLPLVVLVSQPMFGSLALIAFLGPPVEAAAFDRAEERGISVYATADPRSPFDEIAIAPRASRLTMYDGVYGPDVWKTDRGLRFEIVRKDGLVFDESTWLSIPSDLKTVRSWKYRDQKCSSEVVRPGVYEITCAGRFSHHYAFEEGRGITGFDWPCRNQRCWFDLQTPTGIMKKLTSG